jgi:hypothetical protein
MDEPEDRNRRISGLSSILLPFSKLPVPGPEPDINLYRASSPMDDLRDRKKMGWLIS